MRDRRFGDKLNNQRREARNRLGFLLEMYDKRSDRPEDIPTVMKRAREYLAAYENRRQLFWVIK